jgi:hypothetical protein
MMATDTIHTRYPRRRAVDNQENASKTCVDVHAASPINDWWHRAPGAIAERAAAPESSIIQNNPTHAASNQSRPVTAFRRRISMKMIVKINKRENAPKNVKKASICKF